MIDAGLIIPLDRTEVTRFSLRGRQKSDKQIMIDVNRKFHGRISHMITQIVGIRNALVL